MLNCSTIFTVQLLLIIICLNTCDSKYGEKCKSHPTSCGISEQCINGICECNILAVLKYNSAAVASCHQTKPVLSCSECKRGHMCDNYHQCICSNSSEVIIADECRSVMYQDTMGECGLINNTAYFCNSEENSFCRQKRCVCTSDYFYNQTAKSCVSKKNYTTHHNLPKYKAMPEGYCLTSHDCVEGLRCLPSLVCACPGHCKYKKEHLACDCGNISFEFPFDVTIVGCLSAFLSILFWLCLIRWTIRRVRKRSDELHLSDIATIPNTLDRDECGNKSDSTPTSDPPPYTLYSEINSASAPPIGFGGPVIHKPDYDPPPPYRF